MTSEGMRSIRPAEAGDAARIAGLVRRAFGSQSRQTDPPPSALKETAATIGAHLAKGGGAVVERGAAMVGAVLWEEEDGALYISRLSVDPGHRRQGIARALIDAAEREARRRGLARLTLGVRLALEDNRRLFRSCGFAETTLHGHEGFPEPTWVSMERRL
jgi:ribosomal protein S18 acetylase RimI-like enzyme